MLTRAFIMEVLLHRCNVEHQEIISRISIKKWVFGFPDPRPSLLFSKDIFTFLNSAPPEQGEEGGRGVVSSPSPQNFCFVSVGPFFRKAFEMLFLKKVIFYTSKLK